MKIGLIGCGVIGDALRRACVAKSIEIAVYDKFKPEWQDRESLLDAALVFLCVPTPTQRDHQDLSALEESLHWLQSKDYPGVVVIRSTVIPGTTAGLQKLFRIPLVHCPEFLTAARPLEDMLEQRTVLLGSSSQPALVVAKDFWLNFDSRLTVQLYGSPSITEMAKYLHNCFLATKVGFFNEMYDLCWKLGIDYDQALHGACGIGQVGPGHTRVPGPDGQRGFGGMCFIKDTAALQGLADALGLPPGILTTVIAENRRRRPEAYDGREKTGYAE